MEVQKLFRLNEKVLKEWNKKFDMNPAFIRNGITEQYKSMTLLHVAAMNGNNEIIKILMNDFEADVNIIDIVYLLIYMHSGEEHHYIMLVKEIN